MLFRASLRSCFDYNLWLTGSTSLKTWSLVASGIHGKFRICRQQVAFHVAGLDCLPFQGPFDGFHADSVAAIHFPGPRDFQSGDLPDGGDMLRRWLRRAHSKAWGTVLVAT